MNNFSNDGYLDVVFAHRNKAYGAYQLRSQYDKRMLIAGLVTCLFASLIVLGNKYLDAHDHNENSEESHPTVTKGVVLAEIPKVYEEPKEPEQMKASSGRTAKTQIFTPPDIVQDMRLDKPAMRAIDKDALAGPVDNPGLVNGNAIALDQSIHDGNGGPTDNTSRLGSDRDLPNTGAAQSNEVLNFASEMPVFPGGDEALKAFLIKNLKYPSAARESDISGTVLVSFVINTDGSIVDVKVNRPLGGGCSEEAVRVVKAMPRWKAGQHAGHAVRVRKVLPVKFILAN